MEQVPPWTPSRTPTASAPVGVLLSLRSAPPLAAWRTTSAGRLALVLRWSVVGHGLRDRRPVRWGPEASPRDGTLADMDERGAKAIIEEVLRRQQAGDDTFLELVAADMVNHAAGPQGRDGLAGILRTLDHDLGPVTLEQHLLIGEGDTAAQH